MDWIEIIISAAKIFTFTFVIMLPLIAYSTYAERRVSAVLQDRVGPNRVGIPLTLFGFKQDWFFFGLLQPLCVTFTCLGKFGRFPFQPLNCLASVAVQPGLAGHVVGKLFNAAPQRFDGLAGPVFLIAQCITLHIQALQDGRSNGFFFAQWWQFAF